MGKLSRSIGVLLWLASSAGCGIDEGPLFQPLAAENRSERSSAPAAAMSSRALPLSPSSAGGSSRVATPGVVEGSSPAAGGATGSGSGESGASGRAGSPMLSDAAAMDAPDSGSCPADRAPPGLAGCPAACTGGCLPGNVCVIDCEGEGACEEETLVCPEQYACQVRCSGSDACDSSTLRCPAAFACALRCAGEDACGDLQLRCGGGSCSIECTGSAAACSGAQVACGAGACSARCSGQPAPRLDGCASACSCALCSE